MRRLINVLPLLMLAAGSHCRAQDVANYSQRERVTVGVEYSNTSSHILLGTAQNRRIAGLDIGISRRLVRSRYVDWSYDVLLRPVVFVQDPVSTVMITGIGASQPGSIVSEPVQRACVSGSGQGLGYSFTQTCGTRWTYAGGFSPLGQRFNFAPRHRLQPLLAGNGGLLIATRNIPASNAARRNFTFEFGAGLEYFTDARHSLTVDYRIQHLSNGYTGETNPGIDSQIVRVAYSFGR
jgi:hypothetical protein